MLLRKVITPFNRQYCMKIIAAKVQTPAHKKSELPQSQIVKYFENDQFPETLDQFPPSLLRRKVSSDSIYLTNRQWANVVVKHLGHMEQNVPILELNPGVGILTKELLANTNANIHCLESQRLFKTHMETVFLENVDRLNYSEGDLMRTDIRDSLDNGSRMLKYLPAKKEPWEAEPALKIVGGIGTHEFFKYLINSLVFQNPLFSQGRCEFLLFVPPNALLRYICNERAGYFSYRPRAVLFQILFEYEILELMPRKDFLPWVNAPKKSSKLSKLNEVHPENIYLVRIVPRRDLLTLCPVHHLSTLSFFVKQVMSSGKHRIIPYLEKWIDNCGVRIILSSGNGEAMNDPPPIVNGEALPDFVSSSVPLVLDRKYLRNVNISTEFGEISPRHIFQLFHAFINWPEYNNSTFVSLMQQHYMKEVAPKDGDDEKYRRNRRK